MSLQMLFCSLEKVFNLKNEFSICRTQTTKNVFSRSVSGFVYWTVWLTSLKTAVLQQLKWSNYFLLNTKKNKYAYKAHTVCFVYFNDCFQYNCTNPIQFVKEMWFCRSNKAINTSQFQKKGGLKYLLLSVNHSDFIWKIIYTQTLVKRGGIYKRKAI